MKHTLLTTLALLSPVSCILSPAHAEDRGRLIFEDKFDRNESQETTEEIGNGWTTNSENRAGGHKQVYLKDGAMHIVMHADADHAVGVGHAAEFRDGEVELRFMLEDAQDVLGVDIADPQCKEVHSGHLFKVDVGPKQVVVDDKKTGVMNMKFYEARKAKTLTPEQLAFIAAQKRRFRTHWQRANGMTWSSTSSAIRSACPSTGSLWHRSRPQALHIQRSEWFASQ